MATKSDLTLQLDNYHSQALIEDSANALPAFNWEPVDALYKTYLAQQYKIKDRWRGIHSSVAEYVPNDSTVLDLGCGDKEILNSISPSSYYGIDLYEGADRQYDLDGELLTDLGSYDIGLMVESLNFITDPGRLLNHYKQFATTWIITTRPMHPKSPSIKESRANARHYWLRESFIDFLYEHFDSVTVSDDIYPAGLVTYGTGYPKPFIIAQCS